MTTEEIQKLIRSPVYISGLRQPLMEVADILESQDKKEHADALRFAAVVCALYAFHIREKYNMI